VSVIPHGINAALFSKVEPKPKYKKDGRPLVGFVGNMVPEKGIDDVVLLARRAPGMDFVIVSPRPVVGPKNLRWYEKKDLGMLAACDAAIMPSKRESFGLAALEWMALGVPLVAYSVTGLEDVCTESNAYIVPADPMAMLRALQHMPDREKKISGGYDTIKKYTWQRAADAYLSVYEEVLR
jgi:glycosyltransferase involved in cell wall biosynthesis